MPGEQSSSRFRSPELADLISELCHGFAEPVDCRHKEPDPDHDAAVRFVAVRPTNRPPASNLGEPVQPGSRLGRPELELGRAASRASDLVAGPSAAR
jgi:hypothetical protein